jgi:hypothetical protein
MVTVKFTANGAELEAEMTMDDYMGIGYLTQLRGVTCCGEYLDDEEIKHLFDTNPNLRQELTLLALVQMQEITVH